jgi:hypothetical protein
MQGTLPDGSGSFVNEKGYVQIYLPGHPHANKGYFPLHRLMIERHLDRYLEPTEVVHHINEIKTDNRLENLYLCSQSEHVAIHNRSGKVSMADKSKIRQGVITANQRKNRKN